ncbi:6824_t:CDS:2 [Diversispora eburnea]|uniref:6824_t:CDS:1 n=1 Tax=Diversispora eburnea TaxID=1213867 RepID=A0A9N8ZJI1_9GLOM|nr:6824_t:CDS:2 [Diversispora eburnea]
MSSNSSPEKKAGLKQSLKKDLKRQIKDLQDKYPNHEIIKGIIVQVSTTNARDFKPYWNDFHLQEDQNLWFSVKQVMTRELADNLFTVCTLWQRITE